jgi:RNA polymerase sigma-70 factor (ECF subfamily)
MDEHQTIARLKRGEVQALAHLVEAYQVKAMRAAFLITNDEKQAEDLVQEAFLRAYEHINQFDESRLFGPWFLRSVCNAAIKSAKRSHRLISLDAETDEVRSLIEKLTTNEPQPDDVVESNELNEQLKLALLMLTPRQRAAIVQRYYLGMNGKQISDDLGSKPGTVKWLLNSARIRIRGILALKGMNDYE